MNKGTVPAFTERLYTGPVFEGMPWVVRTDLAVAVAGGATVTEGPGCLVVRTPGNPWFHWGNFIMVTGGNVSDADQWLARFEGEFPGAAYRAIGLPVAPDPAPWVARGLVVEAEQSLAQRGRPSVPDPPPGYAVRRIEGDDWPAYLTHRLADDQPHPPAHHQEFLTARVRMYQRLSDHEQAGFFGAFGGDGTIAASLGIVLLGERARYQTVLTLPPYRHQGLATYLLALAGAWAYDRGARTRIIVADADSPAQTLYERVGFTPLDRSFGAYAGGAPVDPK